MAAVASACVLLFVCFFWLMSAADVDVLAGLGQNVSLPCRAFHQRPVVALMWTRPDLGSYVLVHCDDQFFPDVQHPSYRNRAVLDGDRIKDGDASLVLRNLKQDDYGRYESRIYTAGTDQSPGPVLEATCIINLQPRKPAGTSKSYKWAVWAAGILITVISLCTYKLLKTKLKSGPDPKNVALDPEEEDEDLRRRKTGCVEV